MIGLFVIAASAAVPPVLYAWYLHAATRPARLTRNPADTRDHRPTGRRG